MIPRISEDIGADPSEVTPCLQQSDAATSTDLSLAYRLNPQSLSDDDSRFVCHVCLDNVKDPVITQCGHLYCWSCIYRWMDARHSTCPVCKAGISSDNIIPVYIFGSEKVEEMNESRGTNSEGERNGNTGSSASSSGARSTNTSRGTGRGTPPRPVGHRPEPEPNPSRRIPGFGTFDPGGTFAGLGAGTGTGTDTGAAAAVNAGINIHDIESQLVYTRGVGYFPSLITLQFQHYAPPPVFSSIENTNQAQGTNANNTPMNVVETDPVPRVDIYRGNWLFNTLGIIAVAVGLSSGAGTSTGRPSPGTAPAPAPNTVVTEDERLQLQLTHTLAIVTLLVIICLFVI